MANLAVRRAVFLARTLVAVGAVCAVPLNDSLAREVRLSDATLGGRGVASSASFAARDRETVGGRVFIDDVERSLGGVLDYLSRVG